MRNSCLTEVGDQLGLQKITRVRHGCAKHDGPRMAEHAEQAPSTKGVRRSVLTMLSYNFLTDKSLACNLTFSALAYNRGAGVSVPG